MFAKSRPWWRSRRGDRDQPPTAGVTTVAWSPPASAPRVGRSRFSSLAPIAVFDIGGPLVVYKILRGNGHSEVTSLIIAGAFPALGVLLTIIRDRRIDVIGVLVLTGIAVRVGIGLASHNTKLVLLEGAVPTTIFALALLGSLLAPRPLMFHFAQQSMGRDTPKGRKFADLWQYPSFRHAFRVMTVVWGVTYLAVAAAHIVIVETQSAGTALSISKVLPYLVLAILIPWTILYAKRGQRQGERADAAGRTARAATPD
jgi:intracellular septation protein A